MLDRLIHLGLHARGLVLALLLVISAWGSYAYRQLPVDAFPDISPVMVPVFAEAHGMAPEEIEKLIAYPIEASMNGLPDVTQIKSTSAFGMAVVYVYFDDAVDIYFARQLVAERLAAARGALPDMHDPPRLGPISSGLGQVFMYYLAAGKGLDTGGMPVNTYLRDLNDWVVKRQLQTVRGVTDILSMGGHVLQYQVKVNPDHLQRYGLALSDVVEAVRANNRNVGGQFLVLGSEEHLVRGVGFLDDLDAIREIPIKVVDGMAIILSDVAQVGFGNEIRRGVVTQGGEGEVVSGIVMKLYGENTSEVIERLYAKVEAVQKSLPQGVELVPFYEQAELVENASTTVQEALLHGAALVMVILAIFLGNLRSAAIVALALPLCALTAILGMQLTGISANLMSMGGIAIAIGMLGDGAIVMVENIERHLKGGEGTSKIDRIATGACEVGRPIVFSIAIIIVVFLPIFALEGVEGKMFSPMGMSICFALLGSVAVALFVTPVLASLVLRRTSKARQHTFDRISQAYARLLAVGLRLRVLVLALALAALVAAGSLIPRLGTEFIPTLEEGSIQIGVMNAPSIALERYTETILGFERKIRKYPEVTGVVSRIGRPEAGSHPHPVNIAEIHVELRDLRTWPPGRTKQDLIHDLEGELADYPGIQINFAQPIQNLFDELLSGTKAQLAIKVYGENLETLRAKATEIHTALAGVEGLADLSVEQSFGQPQFKITPKREACRRLGVAIDTVLEIVELAIGGEVIDDLYLGTRRYGIHIRYQEEHRASPERIRNILVQTPYGPRPLSELASVDAVVGPIQINRENNQRRWIVQGNVRGRDLGSVFAEVSQRIEQTVELPPGYHIEYGGQFENQQRAMKRLSIIVPAALAAIIAMLVLAFASLRSALIIVVNVPLALIGGVVGLYLSGEHLSVPASVGFIALFGIAVQNGVVLVTCIRQLQERGLELGAAIIEGTRLRLRPVLMTAATTVLGLMPLLVSQGTGAEVQRPLAIVVVYGLSSSTLLTLFVLPAVYSFLGSPSVPRVLDSCEQRR